MDVTKQWMSQSNGCHKAMDVRKQWMCNGCHSNRCHRAMDVTEQWVSQSNGCHRTVDVTRATAVTEQWVSQSYACHRAMDATEQGCQSKGMSKQRDVKAKGCHRAKGCQSKGMTKQTGLIFIIWTFRLWRKSRTKAPFSHLPFSLLEGNLAQKLLFHIFHFQIARGSLARKLLFTQGSLARKLRFHIFHLQILRMPRTNALFLQLPLSDFEGGSRTNASFAHLRFHFQILKEVSHARTLRFHICYFQIWREVSHERFVCTSSTFRFGGKPRTSFVFTFATFRFWDVSHESFVFHILNFHFFGADDFHFKIPLISAGKSSFFAFGVEIRFWSCNFWRCCM